MNDKIYPENINKSLWFSKTILLFIVISQFLFKKCFFLFVRELSQKCFQCIISKVHNFFDHNFHFKMESCAAGLKTCIFFSFFPFYKNYTILFALASQPFGKPQAIGQWIAMRAKVEQKGRVIFLYWEK